MCPVLLVTLLTSWTPQVLHAQNADPPPQASTISAIAGGETTTFIDQTLIGREATDLVGKWIRVFTSDRPAGLITHVTAFDSETGELTLADPLPAGAVEVNDVYHLADSRDVLLPTSIDPATIGLGDIGCTPAGTAGPDTITCVGIDSTGVDAMAGGDTVAVTSPTIVLVTKLGSTSAQSEEGGEEQTPAVASAISLGDGDDRIVNDGVVVSAAVAAALGAPVSAPVGEDEAKADTRAEPTALGIDAGGGQNVVTNNGTLSTSATALLGSGRIPSVEEKQTSADVSSTATATSSAIQAGDDGSFITNTGRIASRSIAWTAGVGVSFSSVDNAPAQGDAQTSGQSSQEGGDFEFKGDVRATASANGTSAGSGNDAVTNTNEVIVDSSAVAFAGGLTQIEAKGSAGASASSSASTAAQGLAPGDGDDTVVNTGSLTVDANARAIALEVAIADKNNSPTEQPGTHGINDQTGDGNEKKDDTLTSTVDASTTASATATGIEADGVASKSDGEPIIDLEGGRVTIGRTSTETHANGNDAVTNSASLAVTATASALDSIGGVSADGSAAAKATSTAGSTALAVNLGGGDDTLDNSGSLTSAAEATATATSVDIAQRATSPSTPTTPTDGGSPGATTSGTTALEETPPATPPAAPVNLVPSHAALEGSATAASTATGIAADGALSDRSDTWTAAASGGDGFDFTRQERATQAAGTDDVTNSGVIGTTATATSRAASIGVAVEGGAAARITSTAGATALGIDLGGGGDTLTNTSTGQLTTTATSTANALSLAVGVRTDPAAKGDVLSAAEASAAATSRATGVSADGLALETTRDLALGIDDDSGLSIQFGTATTLASGDDTVISDGGIAAGATATTRAVGVAVTVEGSATTKATSTAGASATAIDLGGGHDTLTSTGAIGATAEATANALGISVGITPGQAGTGNARAATEAGVIAEGRAVGISADALASDSSVTGTISHVEGVLSIDAQGTYTRAGGNDVVTNDAAVTTTATATARDAGVSFAIDGSAASKNTSAATAEAGGIDAGGGDDTVTNSGALTVLADASANALGAAVGLPLASKAPSGGAAAGATEPPAPPPAVVEKKSAVDGSVTATTNATGLTADSLGADTTVSGSTRLAGLASEVHFELVETRASGDDTVTNTGAIDVAAGSTSRAGAAGVAVNGEASIKMTATAESTAAGIDAGGGNDTVTSHGTIVARADAVAHGIDVAVGVDDSSGTAGSGTPDSGGAAPAPPSRARSSVEAGATADARAIGLAADGAVAGKLLGVDLAVGNVGTDQPAFSFLEIETRESGDDHLTTTNDIEARATATTNAAAIGVTANGSASTMVSSSADAAATALDLGGGADTLTSGGMLTAFAEATARALAASITNKGSATSTEGGLAASEGLWNGGVDAQASAFGIDGLGTPSSSTSVDVRLGGTVGIDVTFGQGQDDTTRDPDTGAEAPVDGADTITSNGAIDASANARASALDVSGSARGTAAAVTDIESEATATGIRGGQDDDVITNLGADLLTTVTATAESNAGTVAVSGKGLAVAADTLWTTGTKSEAAAVGIDGDGERFTSKSIAAVADRGGAELVIAKRESNGAGNDSIFNEQALAVSAAADAPSLGVALEAKGGVAATVSSVETEAGATGIRGGGGDDTITNFGTLLVDATAFSAAANIGIAALGLSAAGGSVWDGGIKAEARAVGIDADGGDTNVKTTTLTVNGTRATIDHAKSVVAATGNDTVANTASVTATAWAETDSAAVGATAKGLSVAFAASTAEATAEAIRGGGGDDTITNGGALTAASTAIARALNGSAATTGGVAIAGNGVWDGGVTAEATAIGLNGDGGTTETTTTTTINVGGGDRIDRKTFAPPAAGNDTITNSGRIDAAAAATTPSPNVSLVLNGLGVTTSTSTAAATSAAIEAAAGDDTVTNHGALNARSDADATTINGSVADKGVAVALADVWDGGVSAASTALGIDAGGGVDTVTNDGRVDAQASATTLTGTAAVVVTGGVPVTVSTSTATAAATAIEAGEGEEADTIENRKAEDLSRTPERDGKLTASAFALATTANVAVTPAGLAVSVDAVWDGGTKAEAAARGIGAGQGRDTVDSDGDIEASSTAISGAAAVPVAVSGVALATATSTAAARADGIDAGDLHALNADQAVDTVTNTGAMTIDANALAIAAGVGVTTGGVALGTDALWNGGTTAEAIARGIAVGAGSDVVVNGGRIDASATAGTASVQVDVAVAGVAVAAANATADARASAIDAGGSGFDDDAVTNTGVLDATAVGIGTAVSVPVTTAGVTVAGNAVWDGGTKGLAAARTIDTGAGADTIINDGDVSARADAGSVTIPVSVSMAGVAAGIATSTAIGQSAAIDGGAGANTIVNTKAVDPITGEVIPGRTGKLAAVTTATAATPEVSFTPGGLAAAADAVWDGGTTADATARGIRTSLDADTIMNTGEIETRSTARSGSVVAGVSLAGVAAVVANSTALSKATAVDADAEPEPAELYVDRTGEVDTVTNHATITADANAFAISLPIAVTTAGVAVGANSVWDGGTTAAAAATGIATGAGGDTVTNSGQVDAVADGTSGSIGPSVAVAGFAASVATSTGKATATAIDAGTGVDTITNTGALTADAAARAGTVTVGVTTAGVSIAGDAVWDGGTTAEAVSRGIIAAAGADTIVNDGDVTARSRADTISVSVDVAVAGVGVAVATSTADARSTAIAAGDGDDTVAHANPLAPPANKLTAEAIANATAAIVTVTPAGVAVAADAVWEGGTSANAAAIGIATDLGADTVTNASEIEAIAKTRTFAATVPVTVYGVSATVVNSSASTSAAAISTGADLRDEAGAAVDPNLETQNDTVVNTGKLTTLADTWATSAGIAFTFGGVSGVGNALWDGGTTGQALGRGIAVGNGADVVTNSGAVYSSANARAVSATAGITVFGVSAAASTATAESRTWAIDGGDGSDTILNLEAGALTAEAYATGAGVNVGFVAIGATAASDTVWNGGTVADAIARGIGGGLGQDVITNDGTISSLADSDTASVSVTIAGIGAGGALATSSASATAVAIDGGGDADIIVNRGAATSTAVAEGRGIGVSATGIGAGISSDAFFTGGATATSAATGITGGAGNDTVWHLPEPPPVPWVVGLTPATPPPNKVIANATSDTQSTQVSVTFGGFAGVATGSTSTARATGIDGGAGDDDLFVLSDVVSSATATAGGSGVSVTLGGVAAAGSLLDNATEAESIATGIAGGAGVDYVTLSSGSTATLTSTAGTKDTAVSVTVAGLAAADAKSVATARAAGIDGGAGNDTLTSDGTMTGTLRAESKARSVSVTVMGATGNASGNAEIAGAGIDGGPGDDTITNRGRIDLTGTAISRGRNVSVGGSDVADTDAATTSIAALTGLAGGVGTDTVVNTGSIDAAADAIADSKATSVILVGAAFSDANSTATAGATGIAGGEGGDVLTNAAGATVAATGAGTTTSLDNAVTLVGASSGGSRALPTGRATGVDGGAGNDTIVNDGSVVASATGTSWSDGSSFNLAGASGTTAGAAANAFAIGMAGGDDDDTLINRSAIAADGLSEATVSGSSWTLAGVAGDRSTLSASGVSVGMSGGSGVDGVANLGRLTVTLEAKLAATGGSDTIFGGASGDTQLTAHGSAFGIAVGDGADTLRNFSDIDVLASADLAATRAEVSFAGSPDSNALLVARADTTGVAGGDGDDWIRNDGAIRVDVSSLSNVTGGVSAKAFGGAASSGLGTANGTGIGIEGNDGTNTIVNARSIDVDALGDSLVTNAASSGLLFGDGDTTANARSTMSAFGIASGAGNSMIANEDTLDVQSRATSYGFANASGANIDWSGDGTATSDARATAGSVGIAVLDGANHVVNSGVTNVTAFATTVRAIRTTTEICSQELVETEVDTGEVDDQGNPIFETRLVEVTTCDEQEVEEKNPTPTYAGGNGNGISGDGTAVSVGTATAEAMGIRAGHGANTLVNLGDLTVTASAEGKATSFADGDLAGDAHATSRATSEGLAVGLQAGDGANTIVNAGTVSVLANPLADASARATGGDICISFLFWTWCGGGGTGTGTAEATFDAEAIGIRAGHGNNVIVNDGMLMVAAAPGTSGAPTDVTGANTVHRSTAVTSRAVGIETGDGNNAIVNTTQGVIDVEARDLPLSYGCPGGTCAPLSLTAVGVLTGSGNDTVVNDGQISAHTVATSGTATMAVAIDTGAGNDRVVLGTGSQTTGRVVLGTGDDRFVWSSNAGLSGAVEPGEGTDTFALGGSVSDSFHLDGIAAFGTFEQFRKEGQSTWTLTGDRTIDWTVEDGTLAVGGAIAGTIATDATSAALAPVVVVNQGGAVTQSGPGPTILVRDNGRFDNRGTIGAALGAGVQVTGQSATVINSGQIVSSGVGVALATDGASMINSGRVTALGGGAAIMVAGSGNALSNDGDIAAAASAIEVGGDGNALRNAGSITGESTAIAVSGAENLLHNDGSITGAGVAIVMHGADNVLDNGGSITAAGQAIIADGRDLKLLNTGSIFGGAGAVSITSTSGSVAAILNDASGSISSAAGVAILGGAGTEQVTNSGVIAGRGAALELAGGDDELRITGNSVIRGVAGGGAGFDTFVLGGSTGVFDVSAVGTLYTGFEDLRVQGTFWALDGTGSADWTIDRGTLAIAGRLTGTVATNPDTSGLQLLVERSATLGQHDGGATALLGGGALLDNRGIVRSTGAGGTAVLLEGAANTLFNTGLIDASGGSDAVLASGGGNTIFNQGRIVSTGDGVTLLGRNNVLHNFGSLSAGSDGSAVVLGGRNGIVENVATISGEGVGITVVGDGSLAANRGAISTRGPAVLFETSAGVGTSLVNEPGALVESTGGVAVLGGDGDERIVNDGTIVSGVGAAIDLGGGDDALQLSTLARVGGTVFGGAGYDTLTLGGSGGIGLDLDTFGGFEMLRKEGPGTWLLSGAGSMDWDLIDGALVLDGELTGRGTVHAGTLLAGNGTVGGFSNAGTVSPGMSIGTIQVGGDYVQTGSGVLEIEGAIHNGVSDRLIVDGRATLGGALEILPEARPFGIATEYTFLEASGGIAGTFGSTTSSAAYLDPFLAYGSGSVGVTLVRNDVSFHGMGDTANARALGASLDGSKLAMARGDFKPLMDEFLVIDAAAQAMALRTLSGELHASVPTSLLRTGEWFFAASAHRRISAQQAGERARVWTDYARFGGDVAADGNASPVRFGAAGFVGGADVLLGSATRLGLSLGHSRGTTELDAFSDDRATLSSLMPAIYGEHVSGPVRVEGAFGYGRHSTSTVRGVRVGSIARKAHADYEADQYSGLARVSVALPSPRPLLFEPFVELRHSTLTRQPFDEAGAESANLAVAEPARVESLRSLVGLRASWAPQLFGVRVEPELSVAWMHEALDLRGTMVGVLSGATAVAGYRPFTVQSPTEARDGVLISLGSSATFSTHGRAFASYDGARTDSSAGHQLSAGVRFLW